MVRKAREIIVDGGVRIKRSDVVPDTVVENDAADGEAVGYHAKQRGNDGIGARGIQIREERGRGDVNARE